MAMENAELEAHLVGGNTTVARCWAVTRRDGQSFGFTDHDRDLTFEGYTFRADTGLSARALVQTTGLAVDNTEALGVLNDASVTEADIQNGRFDGASVTAWLVNWNDVSQREMQFHGTIGEVTRAAGGFQAELRGLSEALNQPYGRVYQKPCSAVLGDRRCAFDLTQPGYATEVVIDEIEDGRLLKFTALPGFDERWFERGRLSVLSGAASGLTGWIKNDRAEVAGRRIELWQSIHGSLGAGDLVRLEAGCDKRPATCQMKFSNFINFQGFPHIPGEDWVMSHPAQNGINDGGSLVR